MSGLELVQEPPDTPDESPESGNEGRAPRGCRPVLQPLSNNMAYPSPPPSPVAAPQWASNVEPTVSSPVELAPNGTISNSVSLSSLPPTSLMQGYVVPPEASTSRTSFPPAGRALRKIPSQPQLEGVTAATGRHYSAPLPLQSPGFLVPTLQNDIFAPTESGPYPSTRPAVRRRLTPDMEVNGALPLLPQPQSSPKHASTGRSQAKRPLGAGPTSPISPKGVPMTAEVCVECMMRDRDMADVDVTSPGVWERLSDVDFHDALRGEEVDSMRRRESTASSRANGTASNSDGDHSGNRWSLGQPGPSSSRESASVELGSGRSRPRRLGRGHDLTEASLKLWTSMKPAASSHRWRTLQLYLREQNRLLAMEQAGQRANEAQRDRFDEALRERNGKESTLLHKPIASPRTRNSTVLPSGITVERVDIEKDERALRKAKAKATQVRGRRASASSPRKPHGNSPYYDGSLRAAASASSLFARPPDDSPERRFSGSLLETASRKSLPLFAQSQTDLRAPSPQRSRPSSLAPSERPLSSLFRGPRSASASVYSFAPSGSMIDMHLGLEQDRQLPLRYEDQELTRQISDDEVIQRSTKKKSKTLAKLFSKLNLRSGPESPPPLVSPRGSVSLLATSPVDEGPLEPPFPSYLAGDPTLHRRSPTVSTAGSSQPVTPDLESAIIGLSLPAQLPLRREKSLPALPYDEDAMDPITPSRPSLSPYDRAASAPIPGQLSLLPGNGSFTPSTDSTEHIGGGRKAKASRVQPRFFGFGGWRKSSRPTNGSSGTGSDSMLDEKVRDGPQEAVIRDDTFVATRYPSLA